MAGEMNYSLADLRAAMGDGYDGFGGCGGSAIWLILLFFLFGGRNGWGNSFGEVAAQAATADSVKTVQNTLDTNALLDAVRGNRDAIERLAQSVGCDFDRVQECCCATQRLIEQVGNATNLSIKDLSANVILQSKELTQLIQTCCCNIRTEMLQGFNGVDKTLCSLNSNMLQGFSSVNTSVERGFASTNFAAEKNYQALSAQLDRNHTAQLINNDKNTDRIIQFMTEKSIAELRDRAAKAEVELSQRDQSAYILNQLRSNGCGCHNNGCGCC